VRCCLIAFLLCVLPLSAMADGNPFLLTVLARPSTPAPQIDGVPVSVDESVAIGAAAPGCGIWLALPDGPIYIEYRDSLVHPDGTWTWVGTVKGAPDASGGVLITFGDHATFGTIPVPSGKIWSLVTLHSQVWLVNSRASPGSAVKAPQFTLSSPSAISMQATESRASSDIAASAGATAESPATVDLLVVYTQGFRDLFGSTEAAVARINHVVDLTNQAFENSGVHGRIRLVHTAEVPYPDNSGISTLKDLMGTGPDGVPESLASVAPLRQEYGADAVTLMQVSDSQTVICAAAGSMGHNLTPITASDAPNAYSFVADDGDYNCGSMPGYGLAEILGQNFGLVPDIAWDPADDGAYSFSHAYSTQVQAPPNMGSGATGTGYTLLAQPDPSLSPFAYVVHWPYFSNPDISLCNGAPCGVTDQSDAARSLNLTLPTVAAFEPTRVPMREEPPVQDEDGNRKSDLVWRNSTSNAFGYWLMDGTSVAGLWSATVAQGYHVAAVGDFNADGRGDVIWTSAANDLYLWSSNGSGFDARFIGTYPAGDTIVGTGDIGGDGKSDLLFMNTRTGTFGYWAMDGANIVRKWSTQVAAGYSIAAVGDFNGDGRADIVWTSTKRDLYLWESNGSDFDPYYIGTYPAGWAVAGTGDVDGDGLSDLLWRNQGSGLFGYWIMNGPRQVAGQSIEASGKYTISAIGDFNGDGRVDVMWTSSALDLYLWTSNGSSFAAQYVGAYPQGWKMIPGQLMSTLQ